MSKSERLEIHALLWMILGFQNVGNWFSYVAFGMVIINLIYCFYLNLKEQP